MPGLGVGRERPPELAAPRRCSVSKNGAGKCPLAFSKGDTLKTFIQPQKKQADEKIEVRLDAEVLQTLRDYAEFLESPQGYIVTEVLRKAFRKDKAFLTWRNERRSESKADGTPKITRRRTPHAVQATAAS